MRAGFREERGAGTAFMLLLSAIALAGAALVFDVGSAAVERSRAADAALALAKAGANEIQVGSSTSIDEGAALATMAELADRSWPDLQWDAVVTSEVVSVTVAGTYEARFMDAFGWPGVEFEVSTSAGAVQ